jgi:putative effector of murein hydrolase
MPLCRWWKTVRISGAYIQKNEEKMRKTWIAFLLGLPSFLVLMFVGETAGLIAAFTSLAVYFFVCEFLLSRRNIDAYRKDWPFMLALDATPFVVVFIMVLVEKRAVILEQGPGILLSACGGTYAGAVVASITAKRMAARP